MIDFNDPVALRTFMQPERGMAPQYIGPDARNRASNRFPDQRTMRDFRTRRTQPPVPPPRNLTLSGLAPSMPYAPPESSPGSPLKALPSAIGQVAGSLANRLPAMPSIPIPTGHMAGAGSYVYSPSASRLVPPVGPPRVAPAPSVPPRMTPDPINASMNDLANRIASKPFDQRVDEYNAANPPVMARPAAPISPPMPSAPFGVSVMPGVIQRGNVANMVGIPTQVPSMDAAAEARAAAERARQAAVATRVNAGFEQQLADNADTFREWGVTPGQNFIGGKQYVDGGGMQWRSNSAIARDRMTPEQAAKYDAAKANREAETQRARQLRFARAQFQGAAQGTGTMFNPGGSIDLGNTMAVNAFARNPQLGLAGAMQQQELNQKAARDAYAQSPEAHSRAMELAGIGNPGVNKPMGEEERIQRQLEFTRLSSEEQATAFYAANSGASDPAKANAIVGASNDWLTAEYARLHDNDNWFTNDPTEVAIRDQRKAIVVAEMRRRGMTVSQIRQKQPFFSLSSQGSPTPPSQVIPLDYTAAPMM